MNRNHRAILACLLVGACGDVQVDPAGNAPPTYAQMNRTQRITFMSTVVLPEMTKTFSAFDATYKNMSCVTCHGSGVADGTYAMPSPQVPPLPASEEAFLEYIKDPEHARWAQFMMDKVWPQMADLLKVDKYDETHQSGFSCSNCHTHISSP